MRGVLDTDQYSTAVREDERTAVSLGINAVPFFVVDRALAASGAQAPDVLLELLRRAWEARPAVLVAPSGASCDIEGC